MDIYPSIVYKSKISTSDSLLIITIIKLEQYTKDLLPTSQGIPESRNIMTLKTLKMLVDWHVLKIFFL